MTARMLRRETLFDVRVIRGKEAWPNSSICSRRLSRAFRVARRDMVYTGRGVAVSGNVADTWSEERTARADVVEHHVEGCIGKYQDLAFY